MSFLDDTLKHVAVLGAAGKMGSGISLLLLQEIAKIESRKAGRVGTGEYVLTLIDSNESALLGLRKYLRTQISKYAEKNINFLREVYANNTSLISNEEIIRAFVDGAMDCVCSSTDQASAKNANMVFEAIVEDIETKVSVLSSLKKVSPKKQYYFTNTSSIPISFLNDKCQLENRIIGYHFYNPPAVQKVLEVVIPKNTEQGLQDLALELAKRLQKTVVNSNDVAGFIGNGFMIPEIIFACSQSRGFSINQPLPLPQAIFLIDKVTHDFLLRPMGIFQLIDYVGIDVCQNIANIMKAFLPDPSLHDDLIDNMIKAGIRGGQHNDGSQKDGFFQYQKSTISAVYDLEKRSYVPVNLDHVKLLGDTPEALSWKSLQKERNRKEVIANYFDKLAKQDSLGASLATDFILHSHEVALGLINKGIAKDLKDIDTVLENGFFHLYGISDLEKGALCKR